MWEWKDAIYTYAGTTRLKQAKCDTWSLYNPNSESSLLEGMEVIGVCLKWMQTPQTKGRGRTEANTGLTKNWEPPGEAGWGSGTLWQTPLAYHVCLGPAGKHETKVDNIVREAEDEKWSRFHSLALSFICVHFYSFAFILCLWWLALIRKERKGWLWERREINLFIEKWFL